MFSFESIVDTVSGAQKSLVETYVTDKKVQAEVVKLVEAQAKFVKGSYQTSLSLAETFVKNASNTFYSSIKKGE